jgi:hypothetical protein
MKKFYGIANVFDFGELELKDQYKFLVDNLVYIEGKTIIENEFKLDVNISYPIQLYPDYIGKDFFFNDTYYKINSDFIDEIFDETISFFNEKAVKTIQNNIEKLKAEIDFQTEVEINEKIDSIRKEKIKHIENELFRELLKHEPKDKIEINIILKNYLSVNSNNLFDYLIGLGNFDNYNIYTEYYHFLKFFELEQIYDYIKSNSDSKHAYDEKALTMPQKLLLIEQLLFYHRIDSDTSDFKKAKIYSKLLGYNEDNIRKKLNEFDKKPTKRLKDDELKIETILKNL